MAIRLIDQYPNRANPATPDYPHGSVRNESSPGANDGTPLEKAWANDIAGFLQRLLKEAGADPSGTPDTVQVSQYFDALKTAMLPRSEVGVGQRQVPTNRMIDLRFRGLELIAHRGFVKQAPENTLLAMSTALSRGAHALECDVQPSADGDLYLFHDVTVDALTTGTGVFVELESSYIDGLSFNSTVDTPFADMRLTRFREFLRFAKRRGVFVYPEIKSRRTTTDVDAMMQEVVDEGMDELCLMQSFHISDLEHVREINQNVGIGLLQLTSSGYEQSVAALAELGNGSLLLQYQALLDSPAIVGYCRERGVDVGAWVVNGSIEAARLRAIGVTKIMSDISLEA